MSSAAKPELTPSLLSSPSPSPSPGTDPSSPSPGTDARRHPRVPVDVRASATLANRDEAETFDVVLVDMSRGGVLVEPRRARFDDQLPPVGARSTLTFKMLGNRLCEANGRVVRHQNGTFAIAFQELNRAMESFLRHLARLPSALRDIYVIDVYRPRLSLRA